MISLPKALIFDCDGTLALSGPLHFDAFSEALLAHTGLAMEWDWYHARGGLARPLLIEAFAELHGLVLDVPRISQESIDITVRTASIAVENPPVAALARAWRPRPAAVATNAEAPVVNSILAACELRPLFDTVVSLSEAVVPKPDPRMFLMAAEALGAAPAECLVLEDSAQGMEAARRAGIPAIDVREAESIAKIEAMIAALG